MTFVPTSPAPPPHLSESIFRKYESHIETLLRNWPNTTSFFPSEVRPTTFIARIRDAINSVLTYHWSTSLDISKLEKIWTIDRELIFKSGSNHLEVLAIKYKTKSENIAAKVVSDLDVNKFSIIAENADATALLAMAYLLEKKYLKKPVKLIKPDVKILEHVASTYDVAIVLDPEEEPTSQTYIMV